MLSFGSASDSSFVSQILPGSFHRPRFHWMACVMTSIKSGHRVGRGHDSWSQKIGQEWVRSMAGRGFTILYYFITSGFGLGFSAAGWYRLLRRFVLIRWYRWLISIRAIIWQYQYAMPVSWLLITNTGLVTNAYDYFTSQNNINFSAQIMQISRAGMNLFIFALATPFIYAFRSDWSATCWRQYSD